MEFYGNAFDSWEEMVDFLKKKKIRNDPRKGRQLAETNDQKEIKDLSLKMSPKPERLIAEVYVILCKKMDFSNVI